MLALRAVLSGTRGPVVLPSFTFSASGHAVAWNGHDPLFVECDPHTFQIDLDHAAEYLDGASGLMVTHVFGAPADPDAVVEAARRHRVPVVFDAAHALGALTDGRPVGGFGDAEVFSLTPTKLLVAGEGGLVATNDPSIASTVRIGRDYGNPGDYDTRFVGLNARLSEFHAAMALESFEMLDEALQRRRELAALYRENLAGVPGIALQSVRPGDQSTFKDLTITVDADEFGLTRDQLVTVLAAEGIDTRMYFSPPVHRQQAYSHLVHPPLPVTDRVAASVVSLPIYPDLRDEYVERVAQTIAVAQDHSDVLGECFSRGGAGARSGGRVIELT
jgi:dTDP-4-amino-4,6-dideoxygalactose transaminase